MGRENIKKLIFLALISFFLFLTLVSGIFDLNVDVNKDCSINIFDLASLGLSYGSSPGDSNWNENADIDKNNCTDIFDLAQIGLFYNSQARSSDLITVDDDGEADVPDLYQASSCCQDGDKILVKNGTYFYFGNSGAEFIDKKNIALVGESILGVVLVGGLYSQDTIYSGLVLINSSNITIRNLKQSRGYYGLVISNSANLSVHSLELSENIRSGILLYNSSYNLLQNLSIKQNNLFDEDYGGAVYFDESNTNTIKESNISFNNASGIRLRKSENNQIYANQVSYNQHSGLSFFSNEEREKNSYHDNLIFSNRVCDLWLDPSCYEDRTPPAKILDLDAIPGDENGEVLINWTAVGENGYYGIAESYILKYNYTTPLNETNWDSSKTYTESLSWKPIASGLEESKLLNGFTLGNSYWFAIRAKDKNNLLSDVSNSDELPRISIDLLQCIKLKTNIPCNAIPSTANPSTKYLYDALNFTATITNQGSLEKTIPLTFFGLQVPGTGDGDPLTSVTINLLSGETKIGNWLWSTTISSLIQTKIKYLQNIQQTYDRFKVWSLKDYGNVTWFSQTANPAQTGILSNNSFYVQVRVWNNRDATEDFYDIPTTLDIAGTAFSVKGHSVSGSNNCDASTGDKVCYINRAAGASSTSHYWQINPLSAGIYNVSVALGNQGDQFEISRIIEVVDP